MNSENRLRTAKNLRVPLSPDSEHSIREVAVAVWADLAQLHIIPTPHAYSVWFEHKTGRQPALSAAITAHTKQGGEYDEKVIERFYTDFLTGTEIDVEDIITNVSDIEEAADTLIGQVRDGQGGLSEYGEALATWKSRLINNPTINSLVSAVAALTAETAKSAERNRSLEAQLAASLSRITKLRNSLTIARTEAATDALTSLCNRRAFDARLRRIVTQAKSEPGLIFSVILVDVDHFKTFNDTYGHKTGDLVLRLIARLLSDSVKGRDTVARYGGEEFAILLVGANVRSATVVAQQICKTLADARLTQKSRSLPFTQITLSAGVAQFRDGETIAAWVERADSALYRAKNNGRNQVCNETD
jgi:diguanylate cyclase